MPFFAVSRMDVQRRHQITPTLGSPQQETIAGARPVSLAGRMAVDVRLPFIVVMGLFVSDPPGRSLGLDVLLARRDQGGNRLVSRLLRLPR
jgi:hypothetical protein